jgi:guanosine-3',5'-bis(diphosphate) 3'-pyrophosphohydrolase
MKIIPNYTKAAYFAAVKHNGQLRKNANNEPYINHPLQVANFILDSGVDDPVTLCAAVLHDTLEDTETTEEEIKTLFGEEVLKIVEECSDDKNLGKVERKVQQIEHSKHISK